MATAALPASLYTQQHLMLLLYQYCCDHSECGSQLQCGFGRVGSHFWGFELQSVVPDMVTLGKPIGNGFPMGAVVMSPRLAQGFSNGMEYFNTCGGCTGAAAAGQSFLPCLLHPPIHSLRDHVL